jgi:F420H(2)-dependent quinone reductase
MSESTQIDQALQAGGIVDITTTGRRSLEPRRIEIYFHNLDGRYFLTGKPGFARDWVANLAADPNFTVHFKRGIETDMPAVGRVIRDRDERRRVISRARVESWGADPAQVEEDIDHWIDTAPLVEFEPAA